MKINRLPLQGYVYAVFLFMALFDKFFKQIIVYFMATQMYIFSQNVECDMCGV